MDYWIYCMCDIIDVEIVVDIWQVVCMNFGVGNFDRLLIYLIELGKFDYFDFLDDQKFLMQWKIKVDVVGFLKFFVVFVWN